MLKSITKTITITIDKTLLNQDDQYDNSDLPEANFRSRCHTWPRQLQLQQQQQQQQRRLQQPLQQSFFQHQPTLQEYTELGSVKEFGSSSALNSVKSGSYMLANRLIAPPSPWRPKVVPQACSSGEKFLINLFPNIINFQSICQRSWFAFKWIWVQIPVFRRILCPVEHCC